MSNVLLIWEEIPENTRVFFLENVSEEEFALLKASNGSYINCNTNTEAAERVSVRVAALESAECYDTDVEHIGAWLPHEILNRETENAYQTKLAIDLVVMSGFAL